MAPILTESPAAGAVAAEVLAGLYQRLSACLVDPSWSSNPAAVKQARILSRRLKAALEFFGGKPLRLVRQLDRATAPLAKLRDVDAIADLLAKRGQPDALVVLSAQRAKGQLRTAKVAAWVAAPDADLDAHAERLLEAPPVPLDAFGADQLRRRREQFALRLASAGRTD